MGTNGIGSMGGATLMGALRALAVPLALTLATPAAHAQDGPSGPVVVELFTSQGCSSCPPADAMMRDLAHRDGVIALAFHVDYWDYIGWRDSFGSAANTDRQTAYARAAQSTTVYTPQFIVGGVDHVIGARGMELVDRIEAHAQDDSGVRVDAVRTDGTVEIRAEAASAGPMIVQLVRYAPSQTVAIESGENAGLTLEYANVVMAWQVVADWDGASPLALSVSVTGDWPSVVLIQRQGAGPILAATEVD